MIEETQEQKVVHDVFDKIVAPNTEFEPPAKEVVAEEEEEVVVEKEKEVVADKDKVEAKSDKEGDDLQEKMEDSPEDGDDDKKDESDLFEDFKFENEEDGEQVSDDIKYVADTLGLTDVKSKEDVILAFNKMKTSAEAQDSLYANDEVKSYMSKVNQIAKDGGDWKGYVESTRDLSDKEQTLGKAKGTLKRFNELRKSGDVDEMKELLLAYEENQNRPIDYIAELRERLDVMDSFDVLNKGYELIDRYINSYNSKVNSLNSDVSELRQAQDSILETQRKERDEFQKLTRKSITEYKNEVSDRFTKPVQKLATKLFNSEMVSVSVPKGIANMLLLGEDGKGLSPEKAIESLSAMAFGSQQIKFLQKAARVKAFRKLQKPNSANANKSDGVGENEGKGRDVFDGGFTLLN